MEEKKPRKPRKKGPSLRAAITAKCKSCIYDELSSGTWRKQVEDCTSEKSCPLWPVRPKTTKTTNGENDNGKAAKGQ